MEKHVDSLPPRAKRKPLKDARDGENRKKPRPADKSETTPSFSDVVSQSTSESEQIQLLEQALHLKKKQFLENSYEMFRIGLVACVCHKEIRRQLKEAGADYDAIDPIGHCSCKDFVAAAQTRRLRSNHRLGIPESTGLDPSQSGEFQLSELDLTAVFNLATTSSCTCGSGRIRCTKPLHLELLDQIAAIAAKLGHHQQALDIGQLLIDLAPQQAEGYLHLAKAVLATGQTSSKAAPRFVARCIYSHGMHNVRTHGDPSSKFAQVLGHCCSEYGRGDYIPSLPVETAEMIFQHLTLRGLIACRRVSKKWAAVLQRIKLRLQRVELVGMKYPSPKNLQKLFRSMPGLQAKELYICFLKGGKYIDKHVEAALRHFRAVETLELKAHSGLVDEELGYMLKGHIWPPPLTQCRKLDLGYITEKNSAVVLGLLRTTSRTLESFKISGEICGLVKFPLPKLTCLEVSRNDWCGRENRAFLPSICMAAPALRQLFLDDVTILDANSAIFDVLPGYNPNTILQGIHTLVLGTNVAFSKYQNPRTLSQEPRIFPLLPPGMHCIDLRCENEWLVEDVLFKPPNASYPDGDGHEDHANSHGDRVRQFAHLEAFRCVASIRRPERLFELIAPSLGADGKLSILELSASNLEDEFLHDPRFAIPFPERLRAVGLYHLDWDRHAGPGYLRGRSFLDWVAQFRNAEDIAIYPDWRWGESEELAVALVEQRVRGRGSSGSAADSGGSGKEDDGSEGRPLRNLYLSSLQVSVFERLRAITGDENRVEIVLGWRTLAVPWLGKEEQDW